MNHAHWDSLLEQLSAAQVRRGGRPVMQGGPIPDSTIEEIERLLEVRFPVDYREFLRRYGAFLDFGGGELFGIWKRWPLSEAGGTVLGETRRARAEGMPHHLVAISWCGYNQVVCLDTTATDGPHLAFYSFAERVYPYEHQATFPEYLTATIQGRLDVCLTADVSAAPA
jgi:hypothetical protein